MNSLKPALNWLTYNTAGGKEVLYSRQIINFPDETETYRPICLTSFLKLHHKGNRGVGNNRSPETKRKHGLHFYGYSGSCNQHDFTNKKNINLNKQE